MQIFCYYLLQLLICKVFESKKFMNDFSLPPLVLIFFNFTVTFEHNQHIDLIFPSGLSQVSSDFMYQFRSSPPEVFLGKGILQICGKFTGEHPCRSVISIKLVIFDTSFFSFAVAIFELLCLCLLFYCHLLF